MRKILLTLLSLAVMMSACACGSGTESRHTENSHAPIDDAENRESSAAEPVPIQKPAELVNKMTESELARVDRHALTLLDEPAETAHQVSIEFQTDSRDDLLAMAEAMRDTVSEDEYETMLEQINELTADGQDYRHPAHVLIDGFCYKNLLLPVDYDDGELAFTVTEYDEETGETVPESVSVGSFDEYLDWLRQDLVKFGYSDAQIESEVRQTQMLRDALKTGDYETLPEGSIDPSQYADFYIDPFADYRNVWEYDRAAVEAIRDSVDEISIYDEELKTEFLVHVTLPPDYQEDQTYPVFFLTDGVWRFGNHTELRKVMEDGEAEDVILVSLGYNYRIDGTNEYYRFKHLVWERDMLLDFITDNLMPYLGELYHIDYADSTLYGHSDGGVFAHSALFRSDLYENQPFGHYIIGSSAFWCLYAEEIDLDAAGYLNDYGYFDRNDTLNKDVYLCGGSLEDPDYADKYNGHDTTLEGLAKLRERLEAYGADVTYELYESHHYQFIPEMLIAFLKATYAP